MKTPFRNVDFSKVFQFIKDKDLILRVLIIIAAVFVAKNLYKDSIKEQKFFETSIEEQQKSINIINQVKSQKKKIKEYSDEYGEKLAPLSVMKKIQNIAKLSDVNIVSINPDDVKTSGQWAIMPFSIKLQGGFHNIASFIGKLEKEKWFIQVSNLDFNSKEGFETGNQVLLNVIYLKDAK